MNHLPKHIQEPSPDYYLSENHLCLDIETSNIAKGDAGNEKNRLVYGYGYGPMVGDIHFTRLSDVFSVLDSVDFIICHGSKFELKWLIRAGYPVERLLVYDTLLGDYCIAGNRKFPLDLDSVSKRYACNGKASLVASLIESGVCPSTIPSSLLREYCQQDVRITYEVFRKQRQILRDSGLQKVHYLRCLTTPVLADIELAGLYLDKELVNEIYQEYSTEYHKVASELNRLTGGINMASPQQVGEYLYTTLRFEELRDRAGNPIRGKPSKKYPGGNPLTDEDTLLALKAKTKEQKQFIELRLKESELRKKIGTYCELYMNACGLPYTPLKDKPKEYTHVPGSCIVRGQLNQSIVGTHRLSSSKPNLQNQDRKLKKVVKARKKGWKILSADYATLEMTEAGQLSQDMQVLADIVDPNYDFHSATAAVIFSDEWEEAGAARGTDEAEDIRTDSKKFTFKPLFGGGSGTKEQKEYYAVFKERYKGVTACQRKWIEEVLRTKRLVCETGLMFYWPGAEIQESGYVKYQTQICNYPIQNFSSEIVCSGEVLLWHEVKSRNLKAFFVNVVHDSAVLEVPDEELELVGNLTDKALSKDVVPFFKKLFNYDLNFPLTVEQKAKTNWDFSRIQNDS